MPETVLRIEGEKRFRRMMKNLPKVLKKELVKEFNKAASDMVKDIRASIEKSSGSYKEGPKGHWSSPPGTPPNSITGALARSVKVVQRAKQSNIQIVVDVDAFYGAWLEFGTTKMAPRPFMRPAFRKHSPKLTKRGRKIIKRLPKLVRK